MSKRMLIDGIHPEELRVVVTSGNRLEEYDFETSTKSQFKGNIYLAKVTRVEPSLQAAFVDYGGNRHGFLAFSEIHPDYYQIPIEDREALKADEAEFEGNAMAAQAHLDEIDGDVPEHIEEAAHEAVDPDGDDDAETGEAQAADEAEAADEDHDDAEDGGEEEESRSGGRRGRRRSRPSRRYKIQEVIRRRQVLLVQVVKEERGNKGAALTTYLSLAGRYCVLMPNAARGGGISRKITNAIDRKRLKEALNDLNIPDGMGVIMRTAGMQRSKAEIRRDFDYLMRAWEDIRELTLNSAAPTLVYEEGNLIKRAIRDLYSRDIDEVWIEGAEPYQTAKRFMRLMMPSHAKRVQPYRDPSIPLFHRFQVETQLEAMHNPVVGLKSGGYVVINQTEALVAIDVNSGRSTRERNIEETAVKTNLEAAAEIARQLRLRDLAGLIVIDFIDMEENRNQRAVEKRLKDAMKIDRARIQLGRISAFGLFEMSRQRLRPSLVEASTDACPHCQGTGRQRSTESTAIRVLRAIEEEGIRKRSSVVAVTVPTAIALYILNQKRAILSDIERRYGFRVTVLGDDDLIPPDMKLDRVKAKTAETQPEEKPAVTVESVAEEDAGEDIEEDFEEEIAEEAEEEVAAVQEPARKKRPRRRRKKADAPAARQAEETVAEPAEDGEETEAAEAAKDAEDEGAEKPAAKRRRRGKRGGRRRSRAQKPEDGDMAAADADQAEPVADAVEPEATDAEAEPEPEPMDAMPEVEPEPEPMEAMPEPEPEPEPEPMDAMPEAEPEPELAVAADEPEPEPEPAADESATAGRAADDDKAKGNGGEAADETEADMPAEVMAEPEKRERRRGWWQRAGE